MGVLLEIDNRFEDAMALWRQAITMATAVDGPDSRTAATVRLRVAADSPARNRSQDARSNLKQAFAVLNRLGDSGRLQAAVVAATHAKRPFRWA